MEIPELVFIDVFEMLRSMRDHASRTGDGFIPCDDGGFHGSDLRISVPTIGFSSVRLLENGTVEDPSESCIWRIRLVDFSESLKKNGSSVESALVRSCFKSAAGRRLLCKAVASTDDSHS